MIAGSKTGGMKVKDGKNTSQDKDKAWLGFQCPFTGCERKGQKFTRRNGKMQRVQAKPIPACLAEGHVQPYSNGQCNYPVVCGPSDVQLDEHEYPNEGRGYAVP